jgi:hypothetical protein
MKYRITLENDRGTRYSYIENPEGIQDIQLEEGEWESPFVREIAKTPVAILEGIMQSDYCPLEFHESPITNIKVRSVNK